MRFLVSAIVAAVVSVVAGFAVSSYLQSRTSTAQAVTDLPVLDFQLPDSNGQFRDLSAWSDRSILLNFWATWCEPCRAEMPDLMALRKQFPDRLEIVGLAMDRPDDVLNFINELDIEYPVLLDDGRAMGMMKHYGNKTGALPFSVLISADNRVLSTTLGRVDIVGLAAQIRQD